MNAEAQLLVGEVTRSGPERRRKQRADKLTSQSNEGCSPGIRNTELKNENSGLPVCGNYFSCFLVETENISLGSH